LAAGLRPDPLGELERSPRPRSRKIEGLILRGEEMSDGIGGEGKGDLIRKEGRKREGERPRMNVGWLRAYLRNIGGCKHLRPPPQVFGGSSPAVLPPKSPPVQPEKFLPTERIETIG